MMEMVDFNSCPDQGTNITCSSSVAEEDNMDRYSPTSPTDNSPIQSPVDYNSRTPNRYSPTNPTDDVDDLEDHIFQTDRTPDKDYPTPVHIENNDDIAEESAFKAIGANDSSSQDNDDSDCDSESRLVIQEELEEEKEGKKTEAEDDTPEGETPEDETPEDKTPEDKTPEDKTPEDETQDETPEEETPEDEKPEDETPEDETGDTEHTNGDETGSSEPVDLELSEEAEPDLNEVDLSDVSQSEEEPQTEEVTQKDTDNPVSPISLESIPLPSQLDSESIPLPSQIDSESIPLPASDPQGNCRGDSADNDPEIKQNDVESRKHHTDDSSSDESEVSRDKGQEHSSSSSSCSSSSDQSPEYEMSPDSPSSPEFHPGTPTGEDKSQNESDKESTGELLDEDNSIDEENFRTNKDRSKKGRQSDASPNHEDSHSRCIDDGIDIIEMSDDLDDKDYASEPRIIGFSSAPKGSPALGVTRVIQRGNADHDGRAEGDFRTVRPGEDDSDDDVQIIECPPQEPIDTLIVDDDDDDDDDDDVIHCNNGDPRKSRSKGSRSHRSKKKRTVEQDGHDLRIVIREERHDRDDQDRSHRHRDKGSRSLREERQPDAHRRDEWNHRSSEYSSRRRHRSQSRSRERWRSRRSKSRSHSRDRSSRRRRHRDKSGEHERSIEREREREREKSHRRKRHHNQENSNKSRSRSRSRWHHRGNSWNKENHEEHFNREYGSYRQYRNRHYRHHEESQQEESSVVESHERKRKKRKRDRERGESSTRERRRRRHEDDAEHSYRTHGESPAVDRRHRKHLEEREVSPATDRRRRRHGEREEYALMESSGRSRRHIEQKELSPHIEKRHKRRMKEKEDSPYAERRGGRYAEEHFESPVVQRKSRRQMEEFEEAFPDERRDNRRRQRDEQEELYSVERTRSRRHNEEQNESPVVERRSRRPAEEREDFAQDDRKHRKHVDVLVDSPVPERRHRRSRKHAEEPEWDEPSFDDRSRGQMEELQESPVIERTRTQSHTWSPSDTFQKDPSDSSDSDSSSSHESDDGSEEDDSEEEEEEEEEEVERQVVLVNRDEEEEQILSSSSEKEDSHTDDELQTSKAESLPAQESDVSPNEADDVSVHEVETVPSSDSESEKEPRHTSISEEEPEQNVPLSVDSSSVSAQKSEEFTSKLDSKESGSSSPVCEKTAPEESVYDPAHPTEESEMDKGSESPKASASHGDKVDASHSPKSLAEESLKNQCKDGGNAGGAVPKKDSVTPVVEGARHHLMVNSVLSRPPFGGTLPRPLAAPPLPPGFRLQIGGPGAPISIKSHGGQLFPPGPPPLPRGLSDSTNGPSEGMKTAGPGQPSGLPAMFPSGKEGKVIDKFDNTLANLVVAQNLLTAMKEGQSNVGASSKSMFRVHQPPIPPPPKVPFKLLPGLAQSQPGDSREFMDMDLSPLDDDCELELPTPPDELDEKQKTSKPPLTTVNLKALSSVIKKLTSQPGDDMPASAVELTNKEKYLKKLHLQERVVDEVKQALRPFYSHKKITKEEYKGILRKAVPKICHSKSGNINPQKILQLVEGYVNKFQKQRHHVSKKDKSAKASKERLKANGERAKSTR